MSLTRNPWHVREYTVNELEKLMNSVFDQVSMKGVYGNEKVMEYYDANKKSVQKITRLDIFNLQYKLPRSVLQIPYDILNRMNRKKLHKSNNTVSTSVQLHDYSVQNAGDQCLDLFVIAQKKNFITK